MALPSPERKSLGWLHGVVTLESFGGMIGATSLVLSDGRQVSPFHMAPWFAEPTAPDTPAIVRGLRGEWPCVPFGADGARHLPPGWRSDGPTFDGADVPHGYGANAQWQFSPADRATLEISCHYPETHPIKLLRRTIRPDPAAPALDITLTVDARRACRLPIGLHPTFRLPQAGAVQLVPLAFRQGRVFPIAVEPSSLLAPDASFQSLDAVPAVSGPPISLSRLPLGAKHEDLVQLCGVTGDFVLQYPDENFQLRLGWNTDHFPSVLLWISNRGRSYAPWNSRHVALGIEPVCSAFDLGPAVSNAANPISADGTPTAMLFTPNTAFTTQYRIAVEPLGA